MSIKGLKDDILNSIFCVFLNFQFFPENLHALTELVTLRLDRNKLEQLPLSIGSLRHLEELNIGYNNLKVLPGSIGLLRKLKFFCVDNNYLEHLPKGESEQHHLFQFSIRKMILQVHLLKEITKLKQCEPQKSLCFFEY